MENVEIHTESALLPQLWQHQKDAISRAGDRFALFFDPGCGKTRTAIELYKKSRKPYVKGGKALIFAPLNVCRNWQNELEQYLQLPFSTYLVAGQTKQNKLAVLNQFRDSPVTDHMFLICNTESLRGAEYRSLLYTCGASFVIADESHNFKSYNSLQTKGLIGVAASLKPAQLYLLTGTPAPQGEMDLWSTFYLLGKTKDGFFLWRRKHFYDKNESRRGTKSYWPDYQITNASKTTLHTLLASCSATAKKDEVLDLPELLRTNMYAELSKEQKRHYETMHEYLFAVDEEGNELNAANFLSRSLRLQQITAGFLGDVSVKDNPRLKVLSDAIEKIGKESFLVWTVFQATYDQISDLLTSKGITHDRLTGKENVLSRQCAMENFQAGKIQALICHPKAGGVGVNLTAASYSVHYTRTYSLTDDLQAEARNYRGGSEIHKRITRIDIITPDTIDEEIQEALRQKRSIQDFILGIKEKHNGHIRTAA